MLLLLLLLQSTHNEWVRVRASRLVNLGGRCSPLTCKVELDGVVVRGHMVLVQSSNIRVAATHSTPPCRLRLSGSHRLQMPHTQKEHNNAEGLANRCPPISHNNTANNSASMYTTHQRIELEKRVLQLVPNARVG